MPSAFVLFGELKADTNSFKNSLRDAETRLKTTEAAISKTETRAKSLGQSTNVTARSYEKLRDVLNTAKQKLDLTSAAFTKGDATAKQMRSALLGVEAASARMNSRLTDTNAKLSDMASKTSNLGGRMQNLGGGLASFGTSLATYVTAPLLLASAALSKIGTSADSLRNKMIAATGSLGGANAKILELRTLAGESAGVFSDAAIDLYAFFKPMKTGEQTINDVIRAFGRLQLADDQFEGKEFGRNLTQLFTQGFEMQDMKQAIGRMPRFGELIAKQFNIEGSDLTSLKEGLNGLKDTGKLTLDQFLQGFATAVNNDQTFGLLADTIGIRFSKALERIKIAVEPLANTLLGVLEPMVEPVAQFVEMLGQKFQALSPSVQSPGSR